MSTTFEDRLERELARAQRRRRSGRRRLPALAALAAAVLLMVVLLARGSAEPERPAPAAPPAGAIHYVKSVIDSTTDGRTVIEEWRRGDEVHRIERSADGTALDHVIGTDGVMRQVDGTGALRIVRPSDNADSRHEIAAERAGLVAEFERWVAAGRQQPGRYAFAGDRAARLYVYRQPLRAVDENGNALELPSGGPRRYLYVDRRTGAPLGWRLDDPSVASRLQQRFVAIRDLPPTAANLRSLRALALPRRRDRDGCVRGAAVAGQSQDAAPRSDCGGTPGAVVTP